MASIRGTVMAGEMEGSFYVEKYVSQFQALLGFRPFLGTLNIRIKEAERRKLKNPITIRPTEKQLFAVECYKARINGKVGGAIVVPLKTKHGPDVLEIIAPVSLRELFGLEDGDEVVCELIAE